jgi:membrane fusion protein (multidrug efflux system)
MPDDQQRRVDRDVPDSEAGGKTDTDNDKANKPKKPGVIRRHPMAFLAGIVVVIALAIAGYFYWLTYVHPYETTDDAFIDSRQFSIAAKVSGYVVNVPVTDNQHVDAGDVLFEIDQRDYRIAIDQAKAQVVSAQAAIEGADAQIAAQRAQIDEARAQVAQAEASLNFAREDAARYQDLQTRGASSVQQAQQSTANLQQQQANLTHANAAVNAAQQQVGSLEAQKASAVANLTQAQTQLAQAELNLSYTTVTAAQPGRVVRLTGAQGQFAQAGQSLTMFVPDDIWVTANFKETQITDMRPGQPVALTIDAYPDHEITGRIDSVQPGSGTAFSLLPAENATGNYIKVVQRIPVKITVDRWPDDIPIGPGMSVVPTVTVR